jgi:hypothetical protein
MKTKAEKLKLAAQLLDQDKSYRVIAKRTHLSLNDISALKKQKFGDEKSQTSITADNKYTEAYKLFKQKKYKLIDVAIELGLDERTTTKFWREYCKLENIDGLIRIYDNIGPGLSSFLELYKVMKEQELAPKDVAKKLIDIQELERHEENLKNQIRGMQSQKMRLSFDLDGMQQRWGMLEKYCDERKDELELLQFQISKLRKEKQLHEDGSEAE